MKSASVRKINRGAAVPAGVSLGRVVRELDGQLVVALMDGTEHRAQLGAGVSRSFMDRCIEEGRMVVLAPDAAGALTLWGALQTSDVVATDADELRLSGKRVVIEATEELTLQTGNASLRLGRDGVVRMAGRKMTLAMARVFRVLSSLVELP